MAMLESAMFVVRSTLSRVSFVLVRIVHLGIGPNERRVMIKRDRRRRFRRWFDQLVKRTTQKIEE
jgi:hypothetical protein